MTVLICYNDSDLKDTFRNQSFLNKSFLFLYAVQMIVLRS